MKDDHMDQKTIQKIQNLVNEAAEIILKNEDLCKILRKVKENESVLLSPTGIVTPDKAGSIS